MATNRATARRRSARTAFEDDDALAVKRAKTESIGTAKKANGVAKKAAKTAYDEDDDGFQFTRRTSRRTTRAQPVPEPIPEEPAKPPPARRKKSLAMLEPEQPAPQNKRRSARLSGDREHLDQVDGSSEPAKPAPKKSKKPAPTSAPVEKAKKKQVTPAPEQQSARNDASAPVQTPKADALHVPKKRDGATKIMLPFADTPVINRNKEMRKASKDGHRRSSTGLRGRRASSLIDSGMSNALPHSQVEVRDFYKYIEQSLPEPRRMKQLLTWCGSRALPEKPSGNVKDANAIMAARAIQQELIDDFANKPELSDWFSREDTAPPTVVKKPNPQNVKNQTTLEEFEYEVKRLEEEKSAWAALASLQISEPTATSTQPANYTFADIDTSLLDPEQASILATLQQSAEPSSESTSSFTFRFTTPAALQSHLDNLSSNLEPNIDLFADGVHKIEQYRNTAERVADRVLGTASKRLEERDKKSKEKAGSEGIGVGDVLRGLAGVLNES